MLREAQEAEAMLFNSYVFICLFLPVTLAGFYILRRKGYEYAFGWLVAASLFFYAFWNPPYLILLLSSIGFNFVIGRWLYKNKNKTLLTFGIVVNLCSIGYFKYAGFFIDNIGGLTGSNFHLGTIILPLGISFFTFQQITYLVDAYKNKTKDYSLVHYALFVSFFPQLIAGPIVHHSDILPQFLKRKDLNLYRNLAIGITIFTLGLFKKLLIADEFALHATPVFDASLDGYQTSFIESWQGAFAYTFQLYFDFSAYSDMAIGLAAMFGIKLPLNFYSPYKATSIIDFWRRWHITLSVFLRDYLYIPLGGNRFGDFSKYKNLLITMFLGGLWHGAGWTFILWGTAHGMMLVINHLWRSIAVTQKYAKTFIYRFAALCLTFTCICFAWVFFRAETLGSGIIIAKGMLGLNGVSMPTHYQSVFAPLKAIGIVFNNDTTDLWTGGPFLIMLLTGGLITFFAPNVPQIMARWYKPPHDKATPVDDKAPPLLQVPVRWRPDYLWAVGVSVLFVCCMLSLNKVSEFLYFQF